MSSKQEKAEIHETEFEGSPLPKKKKIIYFSSGETLEEDESEEEEEQQSNTAHFKEPAEKKKLSFRNVALLVGRMSLLACDFIGERLAGALGLNAAKYQYAIDLYHREQTRTDPKKETETMHLSPGPDREYYGATGEDNSFSDPKKNFEERQMERNKSYHNTAYQEEEEEHSL